MLAYFRPVAADELRRAPRSDSDRGSRAAFLRRSRLPAAEVRNAGGGQAQQLRDVSASASEMRAICTQSDSSKLLEGHDDRHARPALAKHPTVPRPFERCSSEEHERERLDDGHAAFQAPANGGEEGLERLLR